MTSRYYFLYYYDDDVKASKDFYCRPHYFNFHGLLSFRSIAVNARLLAWVQCDQWPIL